PSDTQLQRDVSVFHFKVGDALAVQGKLGEAYSAYREGLAIRQRLAGLDHGNTRGQEDLQFGVDRMGLLANLFVRARSFVPALEAVDQAITLAPDKLWLYAYRASALMFLSRTAEARTIYMRYRGQKNVSREKTWVAFILEDFAQLRNQGLSHPLMAE